MRPLALVIALALGRSVAAAEDSPSSAGPPRPPEGHHHVILLKDAPAPSDGIFADEAIARYDEERIRYYEALISTCREDVEKQAMAMPSGPLYGAILVGVLVGAVGGVYAWKRWVER